MAQPRTTILCSGVALGVYIPALLFEYQLRRRGLRTDIVLLEDLYHPEGVRSLEKLRAAFRGRYQLAQIAQRMTGSMRPQLAPESVDALLTTWHGEGREDFVVWSGFWMPLLDRYRALHAPRPIRADICRIDAIISASFKGHETLAAGEEEIWFWNWNEMRLEHELVFETREAIPFEGRDDRYVIHGGGWGLGEYREIAGRLEARGMALDKVVYEPSEACPVGGAGRSFMVQPGWRPWLRPAGQRPELPPFGEVTAGLGDGSHFVNRDGCHELYQAIRRSRAIISKPGGGTLMDSLASATPAVFLEPYGVAEARNADLWGRLGFGMSFEDWADSGFDTGLLAHLHDNLVQHQSATIDYARSYAERVARNDPVAPSDQGQP